MSTPPETYIFNVLSAISTICTIVLLAVYIRLKRNPLIPTCSILILVVNILIFVGQIIDGLNYAKTFCFAQAVILNYLYIVIHALICFMMVDHCLYAFHIKMPNSTNLSFSPYYFTVAFAFPFVPTAILVSVYMTLDNMVELKVTPFYCTIINPIWLTAAWFAVFGVVGMCSASKKPV